MKLNEKGKALAAKWDAIWDKAIELDEKKCGEEKAERGWDVIFRYYGDSVRSAEDMIGILLAANDDDAIAQEIAVMHDNNAMAATPWWDDKDDAIYDKTCRQFVDDMLEFFEYTDEERERIYHEFSARVKVRKHVI